MFIELILVTVMAVLYGFAWHNEPARPHDEKPRNRKA